MFVFKCWWLIFYEEKEKVLFFTNNKILLFLGMMYYLYKISKYARKVVELSYLVNAIIIFINYIFIFKLLFKY